MRRVFKHTTAAAAAALVATWSIGCRRPAPPAESNEAQAAAPAAQAPQAASASGPGAWFVETGCSRCHAVSSFGVESPGQIGPDLALAVEDVERRFGVSIEAFMAEPTGTMALVLSETIKLTPEQKQIAIEKMREAYREYKRKQAAAPSGVD